MSKSAATAAVRLAKWPILHYDAMRKSMDAVALDLRSPLLVIPSIPFNKLTLPVIRFATGFKSNPGPEVRQTRQRLENADVDVLVLSPTTAPSEQRPAVLWMHGGGMIAGTAQAEAAIAGRLVTALGAVAVLPEYRLAPENPFPAGLNDCMAALQWMTKHADELGIDVERIGVCGTSAGGGLAAAVAQRALDEGMPLRVQGLIYPMLDDRTAIRNDLAGKGELTWSASSNRFAWLSYLGRQPRLSDAPQYAAPARRIDVGGLPPAWIGVGELDVFYDEDVAYANKMKAAGVPCELITVPGMYHGADGLMPNAVSMQEFHASLIRFLRTNLTAD